MFKRYYAFYFFSFFLTLNPSFSSKKSESRSNSINNKSDTIFSLGTIASDDTNNTEDQIVINAIESGFYDLENTHSNTPPPKNYNPTLGTQNIKPTYNNNKDQKSFTTRKYAIERNLTTGLGEIRGLTQGFYSEVSEEDNLIFKAKLPRIIFGFKGEYLFWTKSAKEFRDARYFNYDGLKKNYFYINTIDTFVFFSILFLIAKLIYDSYQVYKNEQDVPIKKAICILVGSGVSLFVAWLLPFYSLPAIFIPLILLGSTMIFTGLRYFLFYEEEKLTKLQKLKKFLFEEWFED